MVFVLSYNLLIVNQNGVNTLVEYIIFSQFGGMWCLYF